MELKKVNDQKLNINNSLKVSIITACLNSEKTIEETLRSVVNQTYCNIEHIVIDGKSKDNTLQIVNKYQKYIAKVISEPDKGIYDAFNKGVKESSGDIIYFLNSDDYLHDNEVISDVIKQFETNKDLKLIYGNVLVLNENIGSLVPVGREFNVRDFTEGLMPHHAGVFVKKELFYKNGLFDLQYKIASDFDFVLSCFLSDFKYTKYINRVINIFREGGVSSNLNTFKMMKDEVSSIVKVKLGIVLPEFDQEIKEYYKTWLDLLVFYDKKLGYYLLSNDFNKVAIMGASWLGIHLFTDFKSSGVETVCFLDNDQRLHKKQIKSINVIPPAELNLEEVDAIIIAIEGDNYKLAEKQLLEMVIGKNISIITWREIVYYSKLNIEKR